VLAPRTPALVFHITDAREEKYRTEKAIATGRFEPTILGDGMYDTPMAAVFERLLTARYGRFEKGLATECRLRTLYAAYKPDPVTAVPLLGSLAFAPDVEWSGALQVEMAPVRPDGTALFRKTYEAALTESRAPALTEAQQVADSMAIIEKLFRKFAPEFDADLARTLR